MVSTVWSQPSRNAKNIWLALRVLVVAAVVEGFRTGRIPEAINWAIDKTYHTTVDILFFGGLALLGLTSMALLILLLAQFRPKDHP